MDAMIGGDMPDVTGRPEPPLTVGDATLIATGVGATTGAGAGAGVGGAGVAGVVGA
jgi:hypothetical protein